MNEKTFGEWAELDPAEFRVADEPLQVKHGGTVLTYRSGAPVLVGAPVRERKDGSLMAGRWSKAGPRGCYVKVEFAAPISIKRPGNAARVYPALVDGVRLGMN